MSPRFIPAVRSVISASRPDEMQGTRRPSAFASSELPGRRAQCGSSARRRTKSRRTSSCSSAESGRASALRISRSTSMSFCEEANCVLPWRKRTRVCPSSSSSSRSSRFRSASLNLCRRHLDPRSGVVNGNGFHLVLLRYFGRACRAVQRTLSASLVALRDLSFRISSDRSLCDDRRWLVRFRSVAFFAPSVSAPWLTPVSCNRARCAASSPRQMSGTLLGRRRRRNAKVGPELRPTFLSRGTIDVP